jgi:hypothetical protein
VVQEIRVDGIAVETFGRASGDRCDVSTFSPGPSVPSKERESRESHRASD